MRKEKGEKKKKEQGGERRKERREGRGRAKPSSGEPDQPGSQDRLRQRFPHLKYYFQGGIFKTGAHTTRKPENVAYLIGVAFRT